ncbi:major facilitator superfamily domain-containing protein [Fimicolochytrium jonesii]|uniref:major facilitator superfamily domain-containing protein n=1 Tax=Fimicolochytrium jonesii TaxID=1396493 RepID=UPI0022FF01B1|nr:major facilitator superfamily domain-containing protein [Fimicolochytrium jonesii]KAI8822548.1 major facilitator superfamily domain-containing protein [Fimicolochytrium jonesii]
MAVFIPLTLVASWVIDVYGLRAGLLLGTLLNVVGAWIRYASSSLPGVDGRFALAFVGQVLSATAQPFILAAPPKIANIFFPMNERALADGVMNIANPIGAAVALVTVPMVVDSKPENIPSALLVAAIVASLPVPFSWFLFRDGPHSTTSVGFLRRSSGTTEDPPSPSKGITSPHSAMVPPHPEPAPAGHTLTRAEFMVCVHKLVNDPQYIKLMIGFGVAIGIFNTFVSELSFIAGEVGYSEDEAGYVGFAAIICGIFGSLAASVFLDRAYRFEYFRARAPANVASLSKPSSTTDLPTVAPTPLAAIPQTPASVKKNGWYHPVSPHSFIFKTAYALAYLSLIAFSASMRENNLALLMLFSAIFGFAAFAVLPTSLELMVEITYIKPERLSSANVAHTEVVAPPLSAAGVEGIGASGLWATGQIFGLVMALVTDGIRRGVGADNVRGYEVWVMPVVGILGVSLGIATTVRMKRLWAEAQAEASNADVRMREQEVEVGGTTVGTAQFGSGAVDTK